jgi:hypothetical protein
LTHHTQVNDTVPRASQIIPRPTYAITSKNSRGRLSRGTSGHVLSLYFSELLVHNAWDLTIIICLASTDINCLSSRAL